MTAGSIAVYVHVPYCRHICPYCDFNVHLSATAAEADDVAAFGRELAVRAAAEPWRRRRVDSVFFGGGTPSLFAPASIAAVLDRIAAHFPLAADAEVSLEANPGTVDPASLSAFRAAGVTRLSLGVQSFDDVVLHRLGRDHDAAAGRRAVGAARAAGFGNVSLDLIYAAPAQSVDALARDLHAVVALAPEHVSAYELTWESGTPFARARAAGRLRAVDDDTVAAMDALVAERLAAAGYDRYEISSYARPGFACRHNQRYWDGSAYLGIGPGAHSFAAEPLPGCRWANVRSPAEYRRRIAAGGTASDGDDPLTIARARSEFAITGFRRLSGVDGVAFATRFGVALDVAFPGLAALEADGLVERTAGGFRLTAHGLRFADTVNLRLVP